jgi:hypothetical protein
MTSTFLTSTIDGSESSALTPCCFIPEETIFGMHCISRLRGPQSHSWHVCGMHRLDTYEKSEFTSLYQNWLFDCCIWWWGRVRMEPIGNSYFSCDLGKSHLRSLFKSVFLVMLALILLTLLLVFLRLLWFVHVTFNLTFTDYSASTSSTSLHL